MNFAKKEIRFIWVAGIWSLFQTEIQWWGQNKVFVLRRLCHFIQHAGVEEPKEAWRYTSCWSVITACDTCKSKSIYDRMDVFTLCCDWNAALFQDADYNQTSFKDLSAPIVFESLNWTAHAAALSLSRQQLWNQDWTDISLWWPTMNRTVDSVNLSFCQTMCFYSGPTERKAGSSRWREGGEEGGKTLCTARRRARAVHSGNV